MADYTSIKSWSEDDRPREKLLARGRQHLSDAELLAILIGSGSRGESAVDLSKRILSDYDNNLFELGKVGVKELIKRYKGIGEAKAITIVAALELGIRRQQSEAVPKMVIKSSIDAFHLLNTKLADRPHEEFWVVFCSRSNKVIKMEFIGRGGTSSVVVDPKIILKSAIEHLASSIILGHNHPSGNLTPSREDIMITQKIKDAAELVDMKVLDHIIIGDNKYYSFADEGRL
ncbi:MAG: DNA repair protein RadC [Saprospiraceae bacterium]|nr:MAG: DNA repair protein radc [Bacteroidetes bacterium OLB9]MCO6462723.1 DNA repair protein RadC [Saprospiraceae bacterium]MCZ2340151.1 DNA repair protein RadC [Chitinophagales bacterium]